ncbi:MAG TPA: ArgE/DapE family deacylase [Thermoleophilia bacterium]|nr:ArgE/DapE family deacylase [Thermoleophilia bacterium]
MSQEDAVNEQDATRRAQDAAHPEEDATRRAEDPSLTGDATGGFRSPLEEKVAQRVREAREELVALTAELVACDTTAREGPMPARDEEKLQRVLAARLGALGAAAELWEPEPTGDGDRFLPGGLDFVGRPQLVATLPGAGRGRSLLLNGHIDAVDVEPRDRWTSDPFVCVERDGALFGRGVNDMKGGIACLVVALETLRRLDVRLAGDVVFCTVTDEESSGAGGHRAVEHGVRADAGICAEPTDFAAWVSCRGTVTPTITIEGRAGHAEMRQPHWREGGAVNAIERLVPLLQAIQRLREDWRTRPDQQHPLLSPGDIVPTVVKGGSWIVTYPASCELTCDAMYLPGHVDAAGTGKAIEDEIVACLEAAASADPWLREHPLTWSWSCDVVPAEMPADHPLVTTALGCAAAVGRHGVAAGLDSWHDAATFTRGGTPTFSFGPDGVESAHAVDERVTVEAMLDYTTAIAVTALRWCGIDG